VEDLQADLPLTNIDLEALVEEVKMLTQKAKKADFYYHQMVEVKML
jgi:hypothetical protein